MGTQVNRSQGASRTAHVQGAGQVTRRTARRSGQSAAVLAPARAGATRALRTPPNLDAMVLPVVQDAVAMLLALRTQNQRESQKVREGQVETNREMQKAMEAARKAALKAAEEAAEQAGIWGDILKAVKAIVVAAALAATIATGGTAGPALAGLVLMLGADYLKDLLVELGVDPEVASAIAMGVKLAGAALVGGAAVAAAGAEVGSELGMLAVQEFGDELGLSPEVQMVLQGVLALTAAVAAALGEGNPSALGSILNGAAKITEGGNQIIQSLFQYEVDQNNIDAQKYRMAYEAAMERMQDIIDSMKQSLKSMQRFESATADALAARNEAQAAAARNMA